MKKGILILYLFLSCISCEQKTQEILEANIIKKNQIQGISVIATIIDKHTFQKQLIANGKIESKQKSELRFKTTEQLSRILVKNGQFVEKGILIATLENGLLENLLQKSQITFEKAKHKLQEEKINYGLETTNENEISSTILKTLKIKSGYSEAQNNYENAQLLFNQTLLKAPFRGVVANIVTKVGYHIGVSEVFCTLINQEQIEAKFSVLESEFHFIEKGQSVLIQSFYSTGNNYEGVISEINPLVDESGLIKVKAALKGRITELYEGMNIKVIINKPIENAVVIPKEALVLRSNRKVVFKLENGLAKWNYVEILDENSTSYALKEGPSIGDTIIVYGNMNLSHDAKVSATFSDKIKD
jgi:membrane fusion protein, multidrug efflux system